MLRAHLTALLCLFFATTLYGQITGTIAGNTGAEPLLLEGATIEWIGQSKGAVTNKQGVFSLEVPAGTVAKLRIRYIGYKEQILEATSPAKLNVVLDLASTLGEVTIVETQQGTVLNSKAATLTSTINRKELSKAPCCNLSESFETSAAVDVTLADAVTGTKRVEMLGLGGKYVQLQRENFPYFRGPLAGEGFGYFPGPWAESLQLTRGIGSVVNGYESMTGQINLNYYKPDDKPQTLVNLYGNAGSRMEGNVLTAFPMGSKWGSRIKLHVSAQPVEMDRNNDGFRDMPTGYQAQISQIFVKKHTEGWDGQVGYSFMTDQKESGEMTQKRDELQRPLWIATRSFYQGSLFGKTGRLLNNPRKSIGLIGQLSFADSWNQYGFRGFKLGHTNAYFNGIYQYLSPSTRHTLKTGLSINFDHIYQDPNLGGMQPEFGIEGSINYLIPGAFLEWQYDATENLTLVAGLRADVPNFRDTLMLSPRMHIRYQITDGLTWRISGGSGWRNEVILADHPSTFASNRIILNDPSELLYFFYDRPEMAWNVGTSLNYTFRLNYRPGSFTVDVFSTRFTRQYIQNLETPGEVRFEEVNNSTTTSMLAQLDYSPVKRLDVRLAYKWIEGYAPIGGEMRLLPFNPRNRFLANVSYETRDAWKADVTANFFGKQRVPSAQTLQGMEGGFAPSYWTINAQINKTFKSKWEIFVGVENLFDFRQPAPIVSPDDPWSPTFDAGLAWGPIFGRTLYAGINLKF